MIIRINETNNVEVNDPQDGSDVTIMFQEKDGSYYGSKAEIKIPAKTYELLEDAIIGNRLEKSENPI